MGADADGVAATGWREFFCDSAALVPPGPRADGVSPDELGIVAGFSGRRERGRNTSIFNVFGGRAAIRETLQMQDIAAPQAPETVGELTPIRDIEGVVVKSHNFEEMLGAQDGGRIALAEVIPADRFFAYFPNPAAYELSIFILPLIDNSIYNSLREIITEGDGASVLRIPVIEPEPVATLSMNLTEKVWVDGGGEVLENFAARAGLDTTILDFLGPDLHLSLADADPILEMGSGELTHVFGSMGGGNDMMMISTIVSIFTRPTAISIGLSDAAAVRRALDGSVGRGSELAGRDVTGSLHKIADRDGWVYRINFFDMMTLRLGIEVQDRFLVIRNMPLTSGFRITGVKDASQPGAQLTVSPRACRLQLPALFASAAERERSAAFSGISDLYPLLVTGKNSISEAAETHKEWFGFRPVHPGDGEWAWDGEEMTSNRYGTGGQPTQPDHAAGNRDFGILRKVDGGEVGMRFEDDGLRTTLRWQLRPVAK